MVSGVPATKARSSSPSRILRSSSPLPAWVKVISTSLCLRWNRSTSSGTLIDPRHCSAPTRSDPVISPIVAVTASLPALASASSLAGMREQGASGRGQLDAPGRAREQLGVEVVLEALDRRRQPGLRDAGDLSRSGELVLLCERDEVLHLPEIHAASIHE